MGYTNVQEFMQVRNKLYGKILGCERKNRNISLADLASGIISRTALNKVEKGRAGLSKLSGDTLMLRLGILPEYFESLASKVELERWRLREDICLLVPARPGEAKAKLREYRIKYNTREPLEEQFLLKAECVLMLLRQTEEYREGACKGLKFCNRTQGKAALDIARCAVNCTVREGWEKNLNELWLSPGELEAILLVSAALFLNGREEEAWKLWQAVWKYPGEHQWKEPAKVLILPQAAILGMMQILDMKRSLQDSFDKKPLHRNIASIGREAFELLRSSGCHCYVLPLLDCLCGLEKEWFGESGYSEQIREFRDMFREIYEWFDYPGYRIWQGIAVDNTRDVGITLKMLRKFYGLSRENAVYDGVEQVVTPRQLEKIEKGVHKPSYENYMRLARQYGKYEGWNMPILETDSADVLEQQKKICKLVEFGDWERAEWEIQKLHDAVNPEFPRVKQELLFFTACIKREKEKAFKESLEMMLDALHCTVPEFEDKDMKWWVYQQEEIMIANNVGILYHKLGQREEAERWFEAVIFSLGQLSQRTGVCNYGYNALMESYSNYLSDIQCFDKAVKVAEETVRKDLLLYRINKIQELFYKIARNAYEAAAKKPEQYIAFRNKWTKAFRISLSMAGFMSDSQLLRRLEES